MRLRKEGYDLEFACDLSSGGNCKPMYPDDFDYNNKDSGWTKRRKIKEWCKAHDVRDYKIIRNTGYCKDLYRPVYEMWWHKADHGRWLINKFKNEQHIISKTVFELIVRYFEYDEVATSTKCIEAGFVLDNNSGDWLRK